MLNLQYITPNLKSGIMQTSPLVAIKILNSQSTWLKVATTLEKPQTLTNPSSKRFMHTFVPCEFHQMYLCNHNIHMSFTQEVYVYFCPMWVSAHSFPSMEVGYSICTSIMIMRIYNLKTSPAKGYSRRRHKWGQNQQQLTHWSLGDVALMLNL